ncbi:MAG: DUF998 domain-containing protein [Bacteroidota bacterium]|nr:MAG: DUF998 domain-containing protein [Bacteroidota bacterium]
MKTSDQPQLISYKTLQRTLGITGVSLPVILILGSIVLDRCCGVQGSISNYYHTRMGNVFVGYLCAIGLFLWSYKGYPDSWDNLAGNLACVFAIGVAFMPTSVTPDELSNCLVQETDNGIVGVLHLISAALLFLVLAAFSLLIFTKGDPQPTPRKILRNRIYKACGWIMLAGILIMAIYIVWLRQSFPALQKLSPIFWLEALCLWAFGISWLTKGEVILKDK